MTDSHPSRSRRDVVVVGASAGGVEALKALAASLPPDLPATVIVVLHVPSYGRSVLPAILGRAGPLPARHVTDSAELVAGEILVAPPDHHLVVLDSEVRATRGPRENGHRPAIDVLFRSAARALAHRVVGVELSGVLDDGAAGMWAIRNRGGLVVVQDPADCLYPEMPQNVMATVAPDHVVPASRVGALLDRLCREEFPTPTPAPLSELIRTETDLALLEEGAMNTDERPGSPAGFSCPDCGGTLFEIDEGGVSRYRCRVGHAWTTKGLLGEQSVQLDTALWVALRTLEEKVALATQLSERAAMGGSPLTAARFRSQAADARQAADQVRGLIESRPSTEVELIDE
ncbi:MAG: chemotaxis protein CheB [Nocardioidaceae bacterium]|nr:chemotaxis protein CheB [Nocardioidaceae bacterium]